MMLAMRENIEKERHLMNNLNNKDAGYPLKDNDGVLLAPEEKMKMTKKHKEAPYLASEELLVKQIRTDNLIGVKDNEKYSKVRNTDTAKLRDICTVQINISRPRSDIHMVDLYQLLSFEDVDGGVWKQGFDIKYDHDQVRKQKKLEVIVVPHSHTDPGWLKTFENYYLDQTKNIFENMLMFLQENPEMRFVYAEMSFFELWWSEIDHAKRTVVKKLLDDGRLEILTGGWVMTDEANSHYFSMITQMIEGHEWIQNHIGKDYKPRNHWSIDPFGLSPTMAFLLNRARLSNGISQRVHYIIKKRLAEHKELEFFWRQHWGGLSNHTDFVLHIMPFFSYDIPHTCGPDPKICCQFDFGRRNCPWKVDPQKIDQENLGERAELIYDQYRKKSQLFKTNVLFIPLGDDFRYERRSEWQEKFENYQKLFQFMNSRPDWNIHARFGTVNEYFQLMHSALNDEQEKLPILSGDFFTYADRNDHYWSGYYTSRPFYKRMDRVLQHYLRSAEILFSFLRATKLNSKTADTLFPLLVKARRNLSLFQHHDGITGTARAEVVADYGDKLLNALKSCEKIICKTTEILLGSQKVDDTQPLKSFLTMNNNRFSYSSLPLDGTIHSNNNIILFNSLAQVRQEVVCINVNSLNTIIQRVNSQNIVPQQIGPVFNLTNSKLAVIPGIFELCFLATVPALGFERYHLIITEEKNRRAVIMSVNNAVNLSGFNVSIIKEKQFTLNNEYFTATFDSSTGYLMEITLNSSGAVSTMLSFVHYEARQKSPVPLKGGDDCSGAYLFLPKGPAKPVELSNNYAVVVGPLMSKVVVRSEKSVHLDHTAIVYAGVPYLHLKNILNIANQHNFELAMRLKTSLNNGNLFFTDLNGYQMIKRRRFSKLPLQSHFYPMPTVAFIEDEITRVSLLTAQPLGFSSLESGWMEVMLDRRLDQDDNRGLGEAVLDNIATTNEFRLLVEPLNRHTEMPWSLFTTGYPSMTSHYASLSLNYPIIIMHGNRSKEYASSFVGLRSPVPCDIHMVTLRTLSAPTIYNDKLSRKKHFSRPSQALILHRFVVDCRSYVHMNMKCTSGGNFNLSSLPLNNIINVTESSLTLLFDGKQLKDGISIEPMDLLTVKLDFS